MEYKRLILDRLLDKYEKSRSFTEGSSTRRILLKMGDAEVAEYDVEKPLVRETFNSAVIELADKELVGYEWLKYETDNIIGKVWLIVDNVEKAYMEISRQPKRDKLNDILQYTERLLAEAAAFSWLRAYLSDVKAGILEKSSISGLLPADGEQALAVLKALEGVLGIGNGELLERVFSLRCFGDSKYFEKKVKSRIVGILRRYLNQCEEADEMTEDELLAQVGILQAPELIEFKGSISGEINGSVVDFSIFSFGVSINSDTVRAMKITKMGPVKKILFIENKANYVDFISKNPDQSLMTVYHGGFYSPVKGLFFRKLYEAAKESGDRAGQDGTNHKIADAEVEFFHWSDIDLGGFLIFHRLKTNIIPCLKPYLMDVEAMKRREAHAARIDDKYAGKIGKLMNDPEYEELRSVMEYMLEYRIKLEQEAFLL